MAWLSQRNWGLIVSSIKFSFARTLVMTRYIGLSGWLYEHRNGADRGVREWPVEEQVWRRLHKGQQRSVHQHDEADSCRWRVAGLESLCPPVCVCRATSKPLASVALWLWCIPSNLCTPPVWKGVGGGEGKCIARFRGLVRCYFDVTDIYSASYVMLYVVLLWGYG